MKEPYAGDAAAQQAQDIETILAIRARSLRSLTRHQKLMERVTGAVGRPGAVYLIVLFSGLWMALNCLWNKAGMSGSPPDPPPFLGLELVVSLAALVMSATILSTQNRQNYSAEERSHLDLQVNLLAERKIAKLIDLVEELRVDLPNVRNRVDAVADGMREAIDPHAVLDALADAKPSSEEGDPLNEGRRTE